MSNTVITGQFSEGSSNPKYEGFTSSKDLISKNKSPKLNYLPPFTGGFVGYFAYDYIKYSEPSLNLDAENQEIDLKQNIDGDDSFYHIKSRVHKVPAEDESAGEDDLVLDEGDEDDGDALDLDFGDDSDEESAFEDEDADAFDVDAFFNEMNPTINDAGFGNGFVPDEDNM